MEDNPDSTPSFASRDAWVLTLLGSFFAVFGVLVLIGLCWPQTSAEKLVTVISGTALLVIGAGGLWLGRRLKRNS